MANVTEIPSSPAAEIADSPSETVADQTTSTPKPKNQGGRPPKGSPKLRPEGKAPGFFKHIEDIPQEDWGTRAFLYLYIDEPVCIAKTWGETRYAKKFHAPIFDLEPLKELYGSFKGWLSLNIRKTGKDATDQTDRLDFEIFDPLAPPKIPRKAWANDDRNRRWEALLPPEKPTAAESTGTMIDAMKMYKEIRNEVKEETPPPPEPTDPTRSTLETMKIAKELFSQPAPPVAPAAKDPLEIAVALATTMMQMKADNPVIDMYRDELKALREEIKEERAAMRAAATPATVVEKPKTLLEQLTDFKAIKELFGTAIGATESVRASKTTGLDLVKDLGTRLFESPIAEGLGQWLGSIAQRNAQGNPAPMNGQPQNGVQPRPGNDLESFITNTLNPALLRHYIQGFSGGDFAGWLFDAFPDRLQQLQNFTHPRLPGLRGASAIIAAYKHTESMWPTLSSRGEQEFTKFVTDFCEWKPDQGEPAVDAEVVDSEKEEGPERI